MARITVSASNAGAQRVRELRAQGRDIIGLTIGEPDFETPGNIKEAATAAMWREETKYTNVDGTPELKAAIQAKFKRENGLDYAPEQILVGNGGKQVIYNAIMSTVSAGDEVIIPAPYWVSYLDIPLLAEGTPVSVVCREEDGYKITPSALEAAITPRTKWFVLNSPCNPTGVVYSREELKALAAVLLRHPHVWVLADDIYEHLVFDGIKFASIAEVEPRLFGRTLTVNGVAKTYAMTGWRIGYCGGPAELIATMKKVQSQSTTCASSVSQAAAVQALNGPQDFVPKRAQAFQERRDRVLELLREAPGIQCIRPRGRVLRLREVRRHARQAHPAGCDARDGAGRSRLPARKRRGRGGGRGLRAVALLPHVHRLSDRGAGGGLPAHPPRVRGVEIAKGVSRNSSDW